MQASSERWEGKTKEKRSQRETNGIQEEIAYINLYICTSIRRQVLEYGDKQINRQTKRRDQ